MKPSTPHFIMIGCTRLYFYILIHLILFLSLFISDISRMFIGRFVRSPINILINVFPLIV